MGWRKHIFALPPVEGHGEVEAPSYGVEALASAPAHYQEGLMRSQTTTCIVQRSATLNRCQVYINVHLQCISEQVALNAMTQHPG